LRDLGQRPIEQGSSRSDWRTYGNHVVLHSVPALCGPDSFAPPSALRCRSGSDYRSSCTAVFRDCAALNRDRDDRFADHAGLSLRIGSLSFPRLGESRRYRFGEPLVSADWRRSRSCGKHQSAPPQPRKTTERDGGRIDRACTISSGRRSLLRIIRHKVAGSIAAG
jgi:hypothetical protein